MLNRLGWILAEALVVASFIGGVILHPEIAWLNNIGVYAAWVQLILIMLGTGVLMAANGELDKIISGRKKPTKEEAAAIANYRELTMFDSFIKILARLLSLTFLVAFIIAGWYVIGTLWLICAVLITPGTAVDIRKKYGILAKKAQILNDAEGRARAKQIFGENVRIVDVETK